MCEKLKPCPFCGSEHLSWRIEKIAYEFHDSTQDMFIICTDCGGTLRWRSSFFTPQEICRKEAIAHWNKRVPDTSSNSGREILRENYDEAVEFAQNLKEKYDKAVKLLEDVGQAFSDEQNANGKLISQKISIWDFLEELNKNKEELK